MALDTILDEHVSEMEQIVASVFDTMMGLDSSHTDVQLPEEIGTLNASVYLTGPFQGVVIFHCLPRQACEFAGRFLDTDPPQEVNNDVRDVLGELANMIAGNRWSKRPCRPCGWAMGGNPGDPLS